MILDEENGIQSKETNRGSATRRCKKGNGRGGGFSLWHGGIFICPVCGKKVVHYLAIVPFEMKCPRCRDRMTMGKRIRE